MKQVFLKFLTDQDLPIRLLSNAAALYFRRGGPGVTTCILRMFLEHKAQSQTGRNMKANCALKHNTVHNYIMLLGTALKHVQNPLKKEVQNAAHTTCSYFYVTNTQRNQQHPFA
jgi:hypothetical protein